MRHLLLVAVLASFASGCAESVSDITVTVPPYAPTAAGTALSRAPAQPVSVQPFTAQRGTGVLPGRIGERKTVGDISMGYVTLTPPPEVLLEDAITAEVTAAGNRVSPANAPVRIAGEVKRFEFGTDVTALYWDVHIDAALDLEVSSARGAVRRSYSAKCSERTYSWPSESVIAGVARSCVADIATQFSGDQDVAVLF